jgi:16S rRNA (guanine527-N7)-methyltransferase
MSASDFQAASAVSRETLARLTRYADLLSRWNPAINLVSSGSLADLWRRHMLDSAQLMSYLPPSTRAGVQQGRHARVLVDMGSGGGFPGLVLAILGAGKVHLVESDQRKLEFLREAARQTEAEVVLHGQRLEDLKPFRADVVTARALAPLPELLTYAQPFLASQDPLRTPCALFLKGGLSDQELTKSKELWDIKIESFVSVTDRAGKVLRIRLQQLGNSSP